jgi:hypothetical protein
MHVAASAKQSASIVTAVINLRDAGAVHGHSCLFFVSALRRESLLHLIAERSVVRAVGSAHW